MLAEGVESWKLFEFAPKPDPSDVQKEWENVDKRELKPLNDLVTVCLQYLIASCFVLCTMQETMSVYLQAVTLHSLETLIPHMHAIPMHAACKASIYCHCTSCSLKTSGSYASSARMRLQHQSHARPRQPHAVHSRSCGVSQRGQGLQQLEGEMGGAAQMEIQMAAVLMKAP